MLKQFAHIACAVLASCALAYLPAAAATEKVLYSFQGGSDGARPYSGPIAVGGTLYGTTSQGGAHNQGMVYSLSSRGAETVLHAFTGGSDGGGPWSGLTNVGGTLYGSAAGGGANGLGVVFAMSKTGAENVIYSFTGNRDGIEPLGNLIYSGGTFYGTTYAGGGYYCYDNDGCGTVFSLTPAGAETVLYAFKGGTDGAEPYGQLIDLNGTFYGTTDFGGTHCICGTVFSLTQSGTEKLVHSFKGGSDGDNTEAGMIEVNGTFYGVTQYGGGSGCNGGGCGTVFSITPAGRKKVVYAFQGGNDGAVPVAGLIEMNGALYGTTYEGGPANAGTVFSLTLAGVETVLHAFKGGSDGAGPVGLTNMRGTLYGATDSGGGYGCYNTGCGTVFVVKP